LPWRDRWPRTTIIIIIIIIIVVIIIIAIIIIIIDINHTSNQLDCLHMAAGTRYRFVMRECDGRYRAIAHGWRGRPWVRLEDAARELASKLSIAVTALRKVNVLVVQFLGLPSFPE